MKKEITSKQKVLIDFISSKFQPTRNDIIYPTDCATAREFIGKHLKYANRMNVRNTQTQRYAFEDINFGDQ